MDDEMKKIPLMLAAILITSVPATADSTVTVIHGKTPDPTIIDVGQPGDSVGDQRLWHFDGKTPDDEVVAMDWIMTTTQAAEQNTGLESRVTLGVFSFGVNSSDRILIQGVGHYPAKGSTVKVASTLERAITGGTGRYDGAKGTAVTTHMPDGTWQHVMHLD
jgi:hypothetical protein